MPDPRREDDNPGSADSAARPTLARVTPKNAATLILWRGPATAPEILMGRRHASARFMPGALVFPGGMVDRADYRARAGSELNAEARAMLERRAPPGLARALAIAACRELHEETGLSLGPTAAPNLAALHYLCRAVTPARSRIRFNARFLIAEASHAQGSLAGSGELDDIAWYAPARADRMAPITAKVMAEFLGWLTATPETRAARPLVLFQGMDNRGFERLP